MDILIVEPARSMHKMLKTFFSYRIDEIDAVCNATEALELAREVDYDLILISFYLPDSNGKELCQNLRGFKSLASIPIILLTTEDDKQILDSAIEAGITEIYQKTDAEALREGLSSYIGHKATVNIEGGRVLYIEDSKTIATVTMGYMEGLGLNITHHTHAEEALKDFISNDYDLVLTDILLAGQQSGIDMVRHIRSAKEPKNRIPVLAMSALDDTSRRVKVLSLGANDYICKPMIKEELLARMSNLLMNKRLFDQVEEQGQCLEALAMTDQLTQLYNRHALHNLAPKAIKSALRHGSALSLMVIDVDYFKAINDQHGHAIGDVVLSSMGELLKAQCRQEDIAARFGGEEFVLVLSECSADEVITKAEVIRKAVEDLKPNGLDVTVSVGTATLCEERQNDFETLFGIADHAVYHVKENGRNQICAGESLLQARVS